jgi:hypothetical protein
VRKTLVGAFSPRRSRATRFHWGIFDNSPAGGFGLLGFEAGRTGNDNDQGDADHGSS